ncbi:MAG: L-fuconolactonase, partial [Bradyrhizobium sp.]|nr:L-fuconolactonase [Bradyrhizobium sp.]
MMIIDSQVHAYEANTPQRPWASVPNWPDHVTGDEMVAAMDKVGVDGAIFISTEERSSRSGMEGKMANRSAAGSRLIDRRTVLQVAAALVGTGPALMRQGHAAARPPVVIDAQVHAYAANTPERPWHSVPNWPAHVTGDEMVAAMDKVGVDGAIYISPFSMYQYDGSYAVSVQRAHPDKFALVKPVNPDDPAVADVIADWKKTPGTVGIRIILTRESKRAPDDPGLDRILRAAV